MPAVTVAMRIFRSRLARGAPNTRVVKRKAPCATSSTPLTMRLAAIPLSARRSTPRLAFSPSLIALPSAMRSRARAPLPVSTRSPLRSSVPGTSGSRPPPACSTQAGLTTASTVSVRAPARAVVHINSTDRTVSSRRRIIVDFSPSPALTQAGLNMEPFIIAADRKTPP